MLFNGIQFARDLIHELFMLSRTEDREIVHPLTPGCQNLDNDAQP
jgi:hypothetical protein